MLGAAIGRAIACCQWCAVNGNARYQPLVSAALGHVRWQRCPPLPSSCAKGVPLWLLVPLGFEMMRLVAAESP